MDLVREHLSRAIRNGDAITCETCGEWFWWEREDCDGEHCPACCEAEREKACERASGEA